MLPLVALLPPGNLDVRLEVSDTPFVAPGRWRSALEHPLTALRQHPERHDGTLTALARLSGSPATGFGGAVAPVSYFCTRALESLLDGPAGLRAHDQPAHGCLPTIEDSLLADDIGVVVLLVTADGMVVAQRRAPHLDWRAGHLSVSASGSLEPERDFSDPIVHLDGLLAGARRELAEELGVGGIHDPTRDRLQLASLGIWRELERGGKPELYTLARTPLRFEDVRQLHRLAPDATESDATRSLRPAEQDRLLDDLIAGGGPLRTSEGPVDLALAASLLLMRQEGPAAGRTVVVAGAGR